ncbi:hypothetical protein [Pararhodobacter marinus]|uniref:hypothetical protein n=1 Tax=Pararhodobacter marinus TaxID=2184063 RepID=UPI0035119431
MSIFVAGNSHTVALAKGAQSVGASAAALQFFGFGSGAIEVTPFSRREGIRVVMRDRDYAQNLRRATGDDGIDALHVWAIVMGTHNYRIVRGHFWGEAAPSALAGTQLRPLSDAVIDQIISDDQAQIRAFLENLLLIGARFLVVSCPPLRRDTPTIRAGMPTASLLELDRRARQPSRLARRARHSLRRPARGRHRRGRLPAAGFRANPYAERHARSASRQRGLWRADAGKSGRGHRYPFPRRARPRLRMQARGPQASVFRKYPRG